MLHVVGALSLKVDSTCGGEARRAACPLGRAPASGSPQVAAGAGADNNTIGCICFATQANRVQDEVVVGVVRSSSPLLVFYLMKINAEAFKKTFRHAGTTHVCFAVVPVVQ